MKKPELSKSELVMAPRGSLMLFLKKGGLTKIIQIKNRTK